MPKHRLQRILFILVSVSVVLLLKDADLSHALLRGSALEHADLHEAVLEGADLRGAEYDEFTFWPPGFRPRSHGALRLPAAEHRAHGVIHRRIAATGIPVTAPVLR